MCAFRGEEGILGAGGSRNHDSWKEDTKTKEKSETKNQAGFQQGLAKDPRRQKWEG